MNSSSGSSVFGGSVFCVVTGASRGIGRAIAVNLSQKLGEKSEMVITARNTEGLAETKRVIETISPAVSVRVVAGELGNSSDLEEVSHSIFNHKGLGEFQHAVLIHNAGTIGNTSKKISELNDAEELQHYYFENITSAQILTAKFLNVFQNLERTTRRTVVQISSLAALVPMASWSMYCTIKAARDMLFGVLAKEEPDVKVLSYAPGPINTDMLRKAATETQNDDVRVSLKELIESGKTVKLEDSIAKLLKILEQDDFESGSHIDYYD